MEDDCSTPIPTATHTPIIPTFTPTPTTNPACASKFCHEIKFYLPTSYQSTYGLTNLRSWLQLYVQDMNAILGKNTNRWLIFNPYTDIIFTDINPHDNQFGGQMPDYGFEIWAVVKQSQTGRSYGGYAGIDHTGAAALAGMFWTQVYNPTSFGSNPCDDYWTQINNMLHELAHVFGAGMGEYYSLYVVEDTTGQPPLLNIDGDNGVNDPFWSNKPDFFHDPLLMNAVMFYHRRNELLNYTRFANLTAFIMNGQYRNGIPLPNLNSCIVVVTHNGMPLPDAQVKVYSIRADSPYTSVLISDTITNNYAQAFFAWQYTIDPHNNYNNLVLIKTYYSGHSVAKYWSIYDVDYWHLVVGDPQCIIDVALPEN